MAQSKFFSLCLNNFIHKKLITFNTVCSVFIDLWQWFFTSSIGFIYCSMLHGWSLASNSQFFNIYIWIRFRKAELSLVSLLETKSCYWDPVPIIEMQPTAFQKETCATSCGLPPIPYWKERILFFQLLKNLRQGISCS